MRHSKWIFIIAAFAMGCSAASGGWIPQGFPSLNKNNRGDSAEEVRLAAQQEADNQEASNATGGTQAGTAAAASQQDPRVLLSPAEAKEKAPDVYRVKFETTKGDFVVEVIRDWSPNGADRFYNLVKMGYFQDIAIFRAIEGFMFQFGIHGDPAVSKVWSEATIPDDGQAKQTNSPGTITFAKTGRPDSRSVQFFINLGDNARLDDMGFTPFGKVVESGTVLQKINTEYGENSPEVQGRFQSEGNAFIRKKYPNLDFIKSVTLIEP